MLPALYASTAKFSAVITTLQLIVVEKGKPRYALIEYERYLALQEAIEEWYADQRAIAAYEEWRRDLSIALPWTEIEAEMTAEGLING